MARIRTIKPEFPQSESIGNLSRDARLLYIQLWTIVDDAGRSRAASRMLASLLYPYDDDARDLIEGWLAELEQGEHIRRYEVEGSQYLEIIKWLEHQKIDKPSKSRLPAFVENSRSLATIREASATDLGPSTMDLVPLSRSIEADRPERAPDRFDDFWKAYPRRDGPNPRKPAETKFAALVRSGVDPEMLIAEAKKLATDEAKRGNVGTRFIPQAGTWLNQQRWADHAAVAFMASETGAELPIEQAVQMLARIGHWSRHAGPSPGAAGCRASADLLAKYGFDPDGRKLEQRLAEAS